MREFIKQTGILSGIILVLAAALAYADHQWLSSWRTSCNQDELPAGRICLNYALSQWNADNIAWVDARGEDAYKKATVTKGTVLPIRNDARGQELLASALPRLMQIDAETGCIIIFCDQDCNSSTEIAKLLEQYELEAPIFILEGGWDAIKQVPALIQ